MLVLDFSLDLPTPIITTGLLTWASFSMCFAKSMKGFNLVPVVKDTMSWMYSLWKKSTVTYVAILPTDDAKVGLDLRNF